MAIEMKSSILSFSKKFDEKINLRLGVNSGAVIAGVIGKKRFIYDYGVIL